MLKSERTFTDPLTRFLDLVGDATPVHLRSALEIAIRIGRLSASAIKETIGDYPNDLSPTDVDILVALATQGAPYRAKPTELAAWSQVTSAAITGRVDRLEERGLVVRAIDTEDRRIRWISLTPAGLKYLRARAGQILRHPLFAAIDKLSPQEQETLAGLLRKLA